MSKGVSRRGILLATGGVTTALLANAAPSIVKAQEESSEPIMLEGRLEGEELEADLGYSLYVLVYNRSSVAKHAVRVGVEWHGGGGRILSLGNLPAYDPPNPVPYVTHYLSGLAAVRFQFAWREGLNPFKRYPRPPKKAADGKYFSYLLFGWDERNRPQLYSYESPL